MDPAKENSPSTFRTRKGRDVVKLATTIDNAFPQPVYEITYLYAQQGNPEAGAPDGSQDLSDLANQSAIEAQDQAIRAPDAPDPSAAPGQHLARHGGLDGAQEMHMMSAGEIHDGSGAVEAAPVSNRPKRVRTGKTILPLRLVRISIADIDRVDRMVSPTLVGWGRRD